MLNLEDGGGGVQLVSSMVAQHEERDGVAGHTEQDDRRRQPDLDDVPQQLHARVVRVLRRSRRRPVTTARQLHRRTVHFQTDFQPS